MRVMEAIMKRFKRINEKGEEVLSNKPVEMPLGYHHPPSIQDQIRAAIRDEAYLNSLRSHDQESFEDADDFDVDEDMDPFDGSRYELAEGQAELNPRFHEEAPPEKDAKPEKKSATQHNRSKSKTKPKVEKTEDGDQYVMDSDEEE